jgi:hypothetical protein
MEVCLEDCTNLGSYFTLEKTAQFGRIVGEFQPSQISLSRAEPEWVSAAWLAPNLVLPVREGEPLVDIRDEESRASLVHNSNRVSVLAADVVASLWNANQEEAARFWYDQRVGWMGKIFFSKYEGLYQPAQHYLAETRI